jgi:NAD(P)-dependent dehydrogenase (short-subunit alcohol dehydrogenase family)
VIERWIQRGRRYPDDEEVVLEKTYLDRVSLRRMVTAGDVAATVAYLLSPAGRNISGQSLGVDGNIEAL